MREAEGVMGVVLLAVLVALDGERAPAGPLGRLAGTVRDRMLDVVGPDEIVERVDVNAVLDRVDINELLARVDVNQLLDRVDVNQLLARVDVDRLLADADVNQLLTRVDVDALLDRVDVNHLLDRVDVNRVVDRVEPGRLLDRVDVDGLMDRVDVERLVRRAGVPEIVAESTTSVAVSTLDLVRRQLLALDVVITRGVMRLLGRDDAALPAGPALLAGDGGPAHSLPVPTAAVTDVTGHYAGPVTRLVAHVLDVAVAGGAFTFTSGALSSLLTTVGVPVDEITRGGVLFVAAFIAWLFLYWWAGTAVAGRTPGMAVVGLRIVTREGLPLSGRRASVRVLVLPLSIALLGLGLIGIVVDRERRGLHDVAAGSRSSTTGVTARRRCRRHLPDGSHDMPHRSSHPGDRPPADPSRLHGARASSCQNPRPCSGRRSDSPTAMTPSRSPASTGPWSATRL